MRSLAEYFAEHFEGKVRKIGVSSGCSCPNRDGTLSTGGCIFCNNAAFTPSYALEHDGSAADFILEQIDRGIAFHSLHGQADVFLAYFQSYSNTYGPTDRLIRIYERALSHPKISGLVLGTRPDCLQPDLLDYLERRFGAGEPDPSTMNGDGHNDTGKPFLMVELGVESTLDRTLQRINRGHSWQCSVDAINALASRGIPVGVHLIIGLPGEGPEDYRRHMEEISKLPVTSVKLHQLQVIEGTPLADMYRQDPSSVPIMTAGEYADTLRDILPLLRSDIVVDRLVSESPSELLVAPRWGLKPSQFATLMHDSRGNM